MQEFDGEEELEIIVEEWKEVIRNRNRRLKVFVKHEDLSFDGSKSKFRLLEELHKYVVSLEYTFKSVF